MKNSLFIVTMLCCLLSSGLCFAQQGQNLKTLDLKKRQVYQNGKRIQGIAALGNIVLQTNDEQIKALFKKHSRQVKTSYVVLGVGAGMGIYGALTIGKKSESDLPGLVELNEKSLAIAGVGIGLELIALVMNISSWKKNGKPMIDRYNGILNQKTGISFQLTSPQEGTGLGFLMTF